MLEAPAQLSAHAGQVAGLTTALLWAVGGLLFATAGRKIGSSAVNAIRIVVAMAVLLVAHAIVFGVPWPRGLAVERVVYLLFSGVVGLALGDLFYFHCIVIIGPRLGALLMATAPAMTVALAWQFLDEALGPYALLGIAITTLGVAAVLRDRRAKSEWATEHAPPVKRIAVAAGLLAALGQAGGNVLSKLGGVGSEVGVTDIPPLSAVVIRMAGGTLGVVVMTAFSGRIRSTARHLGDWSAMRLVLLAVVIGPTCGVWLYQVSLHATNAAVAATLVATVPVFMIPVAFVAYRARPSVAAILGTAVTVIGTALLF